MTRELRDRHRRALSALAVALPLLFAAGIAARRPAPSGELPGSASGLEPGPTAGALVEIAPGQRVALRLRRDRPRQSGYLLEARAPDELLRPDLLVYWSPESKGVELSARAWLLGRLRGARPASFRLPAPAAERGGFVVFYSAAWGERLGAVALADIAAADGGR